MARLVYWNGRYLPYERARVHGEDRGFVFADALYEVIRIYRARPFALEYHLARRQQGLELLRCPFRKTALTRADGANEVFLTGAGLEVMPGVSVDQHTTGSGQPRRLTCQLLDLCWGWVEEESPC